MRNKKIVRIVKTGNTAHFRKFTRTHHSAQSTCRPVATLTFTMWSSCPVNCECINCNLYFDICCNPPTPTQKIKTRKIAAKFFNMLSSPSLSADVDLVSSSTKLHAPWTETNEFLFNVSFLVAFMLSISLATAREGPLWRIDARPSVM